GAAPLAPDVLRDFKSIFGVDIWEGYGLTETAPTLASNRMTEKARPGSIGKPLPEVELRLVDENGPVGVEQRQQRDAGATEQGWLSHGTASLATAVGR
ncbi:MAG: AMP-binding protein, partial [Actinobacteria bacterium]|nr:AMP-binding protein [Actinomycetota bacterium]